MKTQNMRIAKLVAGVAAALALCACAKGPGFTNAAPQTLLACDFKALESNSRREGPAIVAQAYGSISVIPLGAVVVSDPGLFQQFITQTIGSEVTAGSTVKATARFANCSGYPLVFQARTHFLKGTGAPAEPASNWTTVHLPPGLTAVYEEASFGKADAVTGFYIEIARL